jgi:hypothetical protein
MGSSTPHASIVQRRWTTDRWSSRPLNQNSETETLQRTTRSIHTSTSTSTRAGRAAATDRCGTGSAGSRTWPPRPPPSQVTAPIRGGAGPGCRRPAGGAVGRRGGGMNAVNAGRPSLLAPAPSPRCCVPVSPLRRSSSSVVGVAGAGDWRGAHLTRCCSEGLARPFNSMWWTVGGVRTEREGKEARLQLTHAEHYSYVRTRIYRSVLYRATSIGGGWWLVCFKRKVTLAPTNVARKNVMIFWTKNSIYHNFWPYWILVLY